MYKRWVREIEGSSLSLTVNSNTKGKKVANKNTKIVLHPDPPCFDLFFETIRPQKFHRFSQEEVAPEM